ncbi:MAG: ABC transporter substrate-binding protein [Gemmatimonadota bacterium]
MRSTRRPGSIRAASSLLCALVLAACGDAGDGGEAGPERRTDSGIRLGGTFRWVEVEDMRSLDPVRVGGDIVSYHIGMNIYDGLVEYDQDLNLRPSLAERWEVSEDGREYTFHLRRGVRFHDDPAFPEGKGRELAAEDVKYSLLRLADKSNNSTGWWAFQGLIEGLDDFRDGKLEDVPGIQVLDPHTLRIRLTRRFGPFLKRIAMGYAFVAPREAVETYGEDFFQHPVGTGAFRFVSWAPNQEVVLEKNPHYWDVDADGNRLPYLDRVEVKLISDAKSAFLNFDTGRLEQLEPIPTEFWTNVFDEDRQLKGDYRKYQVAETVELSTDFYGFYLEAEPWRGNPKLRQAINYAIPRERIIRFVLKGRNKPAHEWVPPSMPGFGPLDWYEYDVERARQLLAEAGFPGGRGLPPITLQLNSGGTINDLVAEAIQSALAEIGMQVGLQRLAWPQHLETVENGKATFFRFGWVGDYPDAENFLTLLSSQNFSPSGNNFMHYANPEFDRLYQAGVSELDPDRAIELYKQAQEIAMRDAPMMFLYHNERVHLLQPYVRNFEANGIRLFLAKYWWLEDPALASEAAPAAD